MGRLGSGMRVSASFQIIPRPVSQLGLGSEPQVVVGGYLRGILGKGLSLGGVVSRGVFFYNFKANRGRQH